MMESGQPCILVVEDNLIIREIIVDNLRESGYEPLAFEDGESAWARLDAEPARFDAILLDRMLPDVDGLEILRRVKSHEQLKMTPVIMQTAMSAAAEIAEGLSAGAFYYLTKPFEAQTMLAIVAAAIADRQRYEALRQEAKQAANCLSCLSEARFTFRTPDEARNIATLVANVCPDPGRVVLGLSELMLNAIEHGNLGIGYEEKSALIASGKLQEEIHARLARPELGEKQASLAITRTQTGIQFLIQDQGKGFDWSKFLEISPERAFDTHGRGIALSRMISFDVLEYHENGREVLARVNLDGPAATA